MLRETRRHLHLWQKNTSVSPTTENPVKALLQLGLHRVVVLLLHLSLLVLQVVVPQLKTLQQPQQPQRRQLQLLQVPLAVLHRVAAVVRLRPVVPAAVRAVVVALDRLGVQDTVTKCTKVLSYRCSRAHRVRCACLV